MIVIPRNFSQPFQTYDKVIYYYGWNFFFDRSSATFYGMEGVNKLTEVTHEKCEEVCMCVHSDRIHSLLCVHLCG